MSCGSLGVQIRSRIQLSVPIKYLFLVAHALDIMELRMSVVYLLLSLLQGQGLLQVPLQKSVLLN